MGERNGKQEWMEIATARIFTYLPDPSALTMGPIE